MGLEGVDGALPGLGPANPLLAAGAGVHAAGLSARSAAHGRTGPAVGTGDCGGSEVGFAAGAGSDPGFTGIARGRPSLGGNDCRRVRQSLPLRERAEVDGLQRRGTQRRLQRQTSATWEHHQDRQRTSETKSSSNRPGAIASGQPSDPGCGSAKKGSRKRSKRSPGRRRSGCTSAT